VKRKELTKKEGNALIQNIEDENGEDFLRHWSERVWDRLQLAHIAEIERQLVDYAMNGWRPMKIEPPIGGPLLGACEEGVLVMSQTALGEWRTRDGVPHKPPRAWMPCPHHPR
jgi:hypothetical protein